MVNNGKLSVMESMKLGINVLYKTLIWCWDLLRKKFSAKVVVSRGVYGMYLVSYVRPESCKQ